MTVKCIPKAAQQEILVQFAHGVDIDMLALGYCRSRRTIIRVLEDHGVDPKIHRRPGRSKPKPPPVEQTTLQLAQAECAMDVGANQWKLRPDPIFPRDMPEPVRPDPGLFPGFPVHPLLIPTPDIHTYGTPWYRRLGAAVRSLFQRTQRTSTA